MLSYKHRLKKSLSSSGSKDRIEIQGSLTLSYEQHNAKEVDFQSCNDLLHESMSLVTCIMIAVYCLPPCPYCTYELKRIGKRGQSYD